MRIPLNFKTFSLELFDIWSPTFYKNSFIKVSLCERTSYLSYFKSTSWVIVDV